MIAYVIVAAEDVLLGENAGDLLYSAYGETLPQVGDELEVDGVSRVVVGRVIPLRRDEGGAHVTEVGMSARVCVSRGVSVEQAQKEEAE